MSIDFKSSIDVESRISASQAQKLLRQILRKDEHSVSIRKHCQEEMKADNLTSVDIINVLSGERIYDEPELEKGTYRYRVETNTILVVIAFNNPNLIRCITAWRKS